MPIIQKDSKTFTAFAVLTLGLTALLAIKPVIAQISETGTVLPSVASPGNTNVNSIVSIGGVDDATVTVEGTSVLTVNENTSAAGMTIGTDVGTGALTIQNGGTVNIIDGGTGVVDNAFINISDTFPDAPSQQGTLDINDGNLTLSTVTGSAFIQVGREGRGDMTVTNGSVVNLTSGSNTDSALINLGSSGLGTVQPGAEGHLTIDASSVTLTGNNGSSIMTVGRNTFDPLLPDTSTLDVQNGGTLLIQNSGTGNSSLTVGRNGAVGIATVTGTGSSVTLADFLSVGRDGGTGTLNIQDSAIVSNNSDTGLTRIGRSGGTGTLNVETGGALSTNNLELGRDAANSSGTANVSGTGSSIDVTDTITVGRDATDSGTLNIGDNPLTVPVETGGVVNAHTTIVGSNTGAVGAVSVNGAGTQLNLSGLAPNPDNPADQDGAVLLVGRNGTGTLDVSNGGAVTISPGSPVGAGLSGGLVIGGSRSNPTGTGDGTVSVDGVSSSITFSNVNGQAGSTQVGRDGTGVLNITNGGTVDAAAQDVSAVGRKTGGVGTVTVDGAGSSWNAGNALFMGLDVSLGAGAGVVSGQGGSATVNVQNGGSMLANQLFLGQAANLNIDGGALQVDSTNTGGTVTAVISVNSPASMNVTNAGSVVVTSATAQSVLNLGDAAGEAGTLNINSGGTVSVESTGASSASMTIGRNGGTGTLNMNNGQLTVNGTGTASSFVNIGRDGGIGNAVITDSTINVLNDNNGAATSSVSIGRDSGTGTVTLNNSNLTVEDFLSVGRDGGTGALTLENGSTVANTAETGLTRIGRGGGTGTLNVLGGSTLATNNFDVGREAASNGTANINGAGSQVNVTDTIRIGRDGTATGTLNIGDNPLTGPVETGGTVTAHTALVGLNENSNGTVNVTGPGAGLNLSGLAPNTTGAPAGALDGANLSVGSRGTGILNVTNGAQVSVAPGSPVNGGLNGGITIGGSRSNPTGTGNGNVNVDGAGSSITFSNANGQAGFTQVGRDGTGVLNITNGGLVDGSAQLTAAIGRKAGGNGTVNVTGAGSTWRAGTQLSLGLDVAVGSNVINGAGGTALLNVANGAQVFANDIVNGAQGTITGGGGTITGNIQNRGTIGPGNSPGLMSVIGDVDLQAGGTVLLELGGLVFDSGYDRLDVVGTTTLEAGSIFDIDFFGGFTAGLGDVFDVLVADNISVVDLGALIFDFNDALLGTGLAWETSIVDGLRDSLRLSVVEADIAVPEPSTLPLFASLLLCIAGIRRARRRA